jgi:hypothetical protein
MFWNTAQALSPALLKRFIIVALIITIIPIFRRAAVGVRVGRAHLVMITVLPLWGLVGLSTKSWHLRHSKIARNSADGRVEARSPSL